MKYIFTLFILLFFTTVFPQNGSQDKKVLAVIGSHQIFVSQFSDRYEDYLFNTGVQDNIVIRQQVLNNMVNEILLRYFDENDNLFNNQDYQKELEWRRKQVILAYLKDQEIYANLTATDKELREAFVRVNEKISARHLYTQTEEEANYLYDLLKMGVDFDNLAYQVFTDSTLRENGGYLGYFTWGDMDPAFEEAAFSLNIGEFSKPVKTAYGYSIIKVEDRKPHPLLTEYEFLQKKNKLTSIVRLRKKRPLEIKYLTSIVDKNRVVFNNNSLQSIIDNYIGISSGMELSDKNNKSLTAAEYEDKAYTKKEIETWLEDLPSYHQEKITSIENLKGIIIGFIIQEKLLDIAYDKGYDKTFEVSDTFQKMSSNLYIKYKMKEISDNAKVPEEDVLNYYKEYIQFFTREDELNVQEIIVADKELANNLKAELLNGKEFSKLAQEFSIRDWSAEKGGEMGYAPFSQYGGLKESLLNASVGEVIGPFNIEGYYGIFKVLGKIEGAPLEFNLIKNEVENIMKLERQTNIVKEYLSNLQQKKEIKINYELLSSHQITAAN